MDPLNDALFWITIEAGGENMDAQFWFSLYGLSQSQVAQIEQRWSEELKRILA